LSNLRYRVCAETGSDVNVKTNKQKIAINPFFISRLTPFSIRPFRSLSFWQGVCQRLITRITGDFLQFSLQSGYIDPVGVNHSVRIV
jgi:hypothetical protein